MQTLSKELDKAISDAENQEQQKEVDLDKINHWLDSLKEHETKEQENRVLEELRQEKETIQKKRRER